MYEIAQLNLKLSPLVGLAEDVRSIKDNLHELKTKYAATSAQVIKLEQRMETVEKQQELVSSLSARIVDLESALNDNDQWLRANNVEIQGVPMKPNENLFDVISKIGHKICFPVNKSQVNYVTRVPSRNTQNPKSIILSFINRYAKEDFVAAARLNKKPLCPGDIGYESTATRIFVNDYLTVQNKMLLTKATEAAKKTDFEFVWVKHCKIMARKNSGSKVFQIRKESDLSKII